MLINLKQIIRGVFIFLPKLRQSRKKAQKSLKQNPRNNTVHANYESEGQI